jgi:hypothetical protein
VVGRYYQTEDATSEPDNHCWTATCHLPGSDFYRNALLRSQSLLRLPEQANRSRDGGNCRRPIPAQQFFRRAQGEPATNRAHFLLGPAPRHIRAISAIFRGICLKTGRFHKNKRNNFSSYTMIWYNRVLCSTLCEWAARIDTAYLWSVWRRV